MTTIAVDYTPAVRQKAGIGRIVRGQVSAFLKRNPDLDVRLFVVGRLSEQDRIAAPDILHGTPLGERTMVRLWHRLQSPWPTVERFTGGPLDLFHATDFVLAPSRAMKTAVTVHDLAFLLYPDASHPRLHRYLNIVVPRSIRSANHVIADSHHTAKDVVRLLQIPVDRVSVVQGAVDHNQFRPVTDETTLQTVRRKYEIGDTPYILALSSLQPRKNFSRLIEAYGQARKLSGLSHRLVIAGKRGWLYDGIFAKVEELGLSEHVRITGYVADGDLPALYSGAEFFAYPSLYEGFGLPIIEALSCGTPVLTADNSCLPEAGGPGALYVDAEDTESIADGLVRLATEPGLAARLAVAGRAHAAQFTWERSADQLMQAYRTLLAA